jgi:hypothetical protein
MGLGFRFSPLIGVQTSENDEKSSKTGIKNDFVLL